MQTNEQQPVRRGLGQSAREVAALTYAAFEALAERRYAAPWNTPARRSGTC